MLLLWLYLSIVFSITEEDFSLAMSNKFGKPTYFDIVKNEYWACRENVCLVDMSSFAKVEIRVSTCKTVSVVLVSKTNKNNICRYVPWYLQSFQKFWWAENELITLPHVTVFRYLCNFESGNNCSSASVIIQALLLKICFLSVFAMTLSCISLSLKNIISSICPSDSWFIIVLHSKYCTIYSLRCYKQIKFQLCPFVHEMLALRLKLTNWIRVAFQLLD